MAKKTVFLLLALVAALVLGGCQKEEEETEEEVKAVVEPIITEEEETVEEETTEEEEEEVIPEGMVVSYLTGEYVDESIGRRRPVAFMLSNIEAAVPQAGIANAAIVYEAPVEGGITRLMAIMEDYDDLEKIGSMRSCRDYFIFYASGFEAIYAHYGQSAYALPYLELDNVNNLSGLASYGSSVYYRTSDRVAPHNAYTSYEGIQAGIEICGYSQEYSDDYEGAYTFCDIGDTVELPGDLTADIVEPGYTYNNPWFEYNEEDGLYYRFQYGEEQIDELTDEQLAYKNIIIQYTAWDYYEDGKYLNIDVDTPGEGYYITNGKAIPITWKKHTPWGATYYYDSEGNEITFNTGKTWVCIVQDTYSDNTSIRAYDDSETAESGSESGTTDSTSTSEETESSESSSGE